MNKKKLGASIGLVSLVAIGAIGLNQEALTNMVKDAPKNYVESISTYKDEDIEKLLNDDKKENLEDIEVVLNDTYNASEERNNSEAKEDIVHETPVVNNDNNIKETKPAEVKEENNSTLSGNKAPVVKDNVQEEIKEEPKVESSEINDNLETPVVDGSESALSDNNTETLTPTIETNEAKVIELPVEGWISHNLNVRSSAKIDSNNILGVLEVGTKISGTESNGWVKVDFNGNSGYISREYLSNTEIKPIIKEETKPEENKPAEEKPNTEENTGVSVNGWVKSSLNLRAEANTSSKVLAVLPKGEKVSGTESNGWVKISYNGKTGYIAKSYISSTELGKDIVDDKEEIKDDNNVANSSTIDKIVNGAKGYLGYKYVYGSANPNVGFDCSGLVYYLYQTHAGITLNRNSAAQASNGYQVSKSNLKPGDLLFFATSGGKGISHVGIYIGNGQMVHASTPATGVIQDNINSSYYTNTFVTARRIIN